MRLQRVLITALTGFVGGAVFHLLGLPIAWMLGPAFAVMIGGTIRPQAMQWPPWLGYSGIVVVAYVLGRTMHEDIVRRIAQELPAMLLASSLWVLICLLLGILFAKAVGISIASGVLGNVPGGLSQMVVIADDFKGADAGIVAIMQTTRVITVLYTVPFIAAGLSHGQNLLPEPTTASIVAAPHAAWPEALVWLLMPLVPLSAWLLRKVRVPAGEFLGPVLIVGGLSVAGYAWPQVPDALLSGAQLLIGIFIGQRVQLQTIVRNKRLAPLSLLSSILLVALTALAAWCIPALLSGSFATWFLALAPGGLGEVAVTAMILQEDVSRVTAYQITRLLFVLLAAPPFIKWYLNRQRRGQSEASDFPSH